MEATVLSDPYPKSVQLRATRKRYRRTVASRKQWESLRAEKGSACRVCGHTNPAVLELHHLVPRDFQGDDVADNLVPLCHDCHGQVTRRDSGACRVLLSRLEDGEYAYAVTRAGEDVFERFYGLTYTR